MTFVTKRYSQTPWFIPEIDEDLLEFVKEHSNRVHLNPSDVILGSLCSGEIRNKDCVIFTETGLLCQTIHVDDVNKPTATSITLPKRMLNYCGFLGMNTNSETVYALRASDVLIISINKLEKLLNLEPRLKECMRNYCIKCIASDYETFVCMFTQTTEKRLAIFLLSLASSIGDIVDENSILVPINLSYHELSQVMYSTSKTIERIMPIWKRNGVISSCKNGMLLNITELKIIKSKYK